MNKQGRRLRHARIGQSSSRPALTRDSMKSRLLCIEFELTEGEEPEEIFFRPIPVSRVIHLQTLQGKGEESYRAMLDLMAEFVVDPKTGNPLASAEDWDGFGIDGVKAIVEAMVEGAGGRTSGGGGSAAGPTTASGSGIESDVLLSAAVQVLQGDPQIAAAFRQATGIVGDSEKQVEQTEETEDPAGAVELEAENPMESAEPTSEIMAENHEMNPETRTTESGIETATTPPNGTSAETP